MAYRFLILITKLAINALALLVVTSIFQGIHFDNNQAMIAAAVVLALVNTYFPPLVFILPLPINILTLGLSTLRECLQELDLKPDLADRHQRKINSFLRHLREHRPLFKELHELIPTLAKRYTLGGATSSPRSAVHVVLEISGLGAHFTALVA